jgi:putative DNA primase/helicase
MNEIDGHVRRNSYVGMDEFENEPPNLIPLKNGIYDLTTNELLPYSKEYKFIKTLGVEYKPEAKCPNFERVLDDICVDSEMKPDLKMKKSILQMFAYCLWRKYPIQQMFFLIGGGANAKGTVLGALQAFLGNENVSNRSVISLSDNRFAGADLYRKYANISNELTVEEVKNVDLLKSLVSGTDHISAERKFEQPFSFLSYAKIIIATNAPPKTNDASDGFYRRLNLIRFGRQFLGKDDKKELKELVKQPDELSGIFNLAIAELREFVDDNGNFKPGAEFSNQMGVDEVRELYERMSDGVASFRYEGVEITSEEDDIVSKDDLYRTYRNYCKMKKIAIRNEVWFWKDWRTQTIGQVFEKRLGSEKIRSICGLKVLDEYIDKPQKDKDGVKPSMYSPPLHLYGDNICNINRNIIGYNNIFRVKHLKRIDSWVGIDGITYKSKQLGDIDNYPKDEAEWLLKNKFVEMV